MNEPIEVKGTKPPGLLPKHVQSWLLVGLALVMVLIMWLTGGKKSSPAKSAAPTFLSQPPAEVNEAKIAELQNRIQELQRQQLVAQSALAEQNRVLGGVPADSEPQPAANTAAHVEDSIQTEKKK